MSGLDTLSAHQRRTRLPGRVMRNGRAPVPVRSPAGRSPSRIVSASNPTRSSRNPPSAGATISPTAQAMLYTP